MKSIKALLEIGVFVLSLFPALAAPADPRAARWTGVFEIRDSRVEGGDVTLTLVCRIADRTGLSASVSDLLIEDPLAPGAPLGVISHVEVDPRGETRIEGRLTVPAREYQHWMRGGVPRAYLRWVGKDEVTPRPIELRLDPTSFGADR